MFNLLQYDFVQNAFLAGSLIAIMAAIIGYFVVLRAQAFAGEALADIGDHASVPVADRRMGQTVDEHVELAIDGRRRWPDRGGGRSLRVHTWTTSRPQ